MSQPEPNSLDGKRILLIIGGGIAAYKALELVRLLKRRNASVRCIMTPAASHFVTALSVGGVSNDKVYGDLFSLTDEAEMGHIELSRDADLLVVAPATANLIARMAQGHANDLATTALLATDKRVLIAPAMNVRMWLHPATQRNLATLKADGVLTVGPNEGSMACGEFGPGRLAEPPQIIAAIEQALKSATVLPFPSSPARLAAPKSKIEGSLAGKHVLVSAGPTHEPIDPVRFIANRSSGKQGYAIAAAAALAGARVTLVSGPVELAAPGGVTRIMVETALEMQAAVDAALPADIAILAAAVADWRVVETRPQKMKKGAGEVASLGLVENPDILAGLAKRASERPKLVIGFAAETEKVLDHARAKLAKKGCDLIVANDVSHPDGVMGGGVNRGGVMGGDENSVHLVSATGVESWPKLSKAEVAAKLIAVLVQKLAGR